MKEIIRTLLREHFLNTPFKGKNVLYHSTHIDSLVNILNTNEIQPKTEQIINTRLNRDANSKYKGVSFTRNQNHNYGDVKLILDGDLIKRDYGRNIAPHDWSRAGSSGETSRPKSSPKRNNGFNDYEFEEFLIGPLKNLKKYLLGIQLLKPTDLTMSWLIDEEPELYKSFKEVTINIPIYDMNFKPVNDIN
jgi:hypothetical protein